MSADNTVVILRTRESRRGPFEYRVAQVIAADNLCCDEPEDRNYYLNCWFVDSPVFTDDPERHGGRSGQEKAWEAALSMAEELRRSEEGLVHGICELQLAQRFPASEGHSDDYDEEAAFG